MNIVNVKRSQLKPDNATTLYELDLHLSYMTLPYTLKKNILAQVHGGYACWYCGDPGTHGLAIDHIYPTSKGGGNRLWNNALSCFECNTHKSNHSVAELYRNGKAELAEALAEVEARWHMSAVPDFGYDPEADGFEVKRYNVLQKFRASTEFGIRIQERLSELKLSYHRFKNRYRSLNGGRASKMFPEAYITGQRFPRAETLYRMCVALEWEYSDIAEVYERAYRQRYQRPVMDMGAYFAMLKAGEDAATPPSAIYGTKGYRWSEADHLESEARYNKRKQETVEAWHAPKTAWWCDKRQVFVVEEWHHRPPRYPVYLHSIELGKYLVKRMSECGMTVETLAAQTGIPLATLKFNLNGTGSPGVRTRLPVICEALGLDIHECPMPNTQRAKIGTLTKTAAVDRAYVKRAYEAGESLRSIATACGVFAPAIVKVLAELGISHVSTEARMAEAERALDAMDAVGKYHEGASFRELGSLVGVGHNWIRKYLVRRGVKLRTAGETRMLKAAQYWESQTPAIVKAYQAGATASALAEQYGCSINPILRCLRKAGVAIRQ